MKTVTTIVNNTMYATTQKEIFLVTVLFCLIGVSSVTVRQFERWANEMTDEWNIPSPTFAFAALVNTFNELDRNWGPDFCGDPTRMMLGKFHTRNRMTPRQFVRNRNAFEIKPYDQNEANNWVNIEDDGRNRNQKRTLLALWSANCVITRNYLVKKKNQDGYANVYAPHYEEVFAAYWRSERPDTRGKWNLVYSSKKPCDYGTVDCNTIRDCSEIMADLFLATGEIGDILRDVAYQTVYISDLQVNVGSWHCKNKNKKPGDGQRVKGYVNWIATDEQNTGLQFSDCVVGNTKHAYGAHQINQFLDEPIHNLARHIGNEKNARNNNINNNRQP